MVPFEERELLLVALDEYELLAEDFGVLEIDERAEPLIGTAGTE